MQPVAHGDLACDALATVLQHEVGDASKRLLASTGVLQMPFATIPLVNADINQHAANENLPMGNDVTGVQTVYALMTHGF